MTPLSQTPTNQIVQKSKPLLSLSMSELTLQEFRLLDIYLSRINSHKPEGRTVIFSKGELESVLGVKKINNITLTKQLENLMGRVVKIPDPDVNGGVQILSLFEQAKVLPNDSGIPTVTLTCTQLAQKYIFNIENIGYIRYKLQSAVNLTSRSSYSLFLYLESNKYRSKWNIKLKELKKFLSCDKDKMYEEFKYFNKYVLKPAHDDINTLTDLRFSYEPIREGRKVTEIQFTILLSKNLEGKTEIFMEPMEPRKGRSTDEREDAPFDPALESLRLLIGEEITSSQMQIISDLLEAGGYTTQSEKETKLKNIKNLMAYYTDQKKQPIKDPFNYIRRCIENSEKQADDGKGSGQEQTWSSINYDDLEGFDVYGDMDKC